VQETILIRFEEFSEPALSKTSKDQAKLVTVLRAKSSTLRWISVAAPRRMPDGWKGTLRRGLSAALYPVGFAHGFCVLSEEAMSFIRLRQNMPGLDRASFGRPEVGIRWPINDPTVSPKMPSFRHFI